MARQEIAETATNGGFDLIVMPTHAGQFRHILIGSTTARMLNDAECTVMTTEHVEAGGPTAIGAPDVVDRFLNRSYDLLVNQCRIFFLMAERHKITSSRVRSYRVNEEVNSANEG